MTARVYINTDTWITLTPGDGFTMADVVSASITFTSAETDDALTLTSADGGIVLGASTMTVKVPDTSGISVSGVYILRITFVDTSGNVRGLEPVDTESIRFY
jgi:hypothetical protein